MKKRLTRSRKDRVIGGVLGGIAAYFDTDPVLVRLGYLALTLLTGIGPGILLYIVAVMIVPLEPLAPTPVPAHEAHDTETL